MIALALLLTTAAAVIYVRTATPVYTAEAQLLATPLSGTDATTVSGLGVLTASSDPTHDIETAASLVSSLAVAQSVQKALGLRDTPQSILQRVTVQPVSQSGILSVTAQGPSPASAAALANGFAQAALVGRTARFRSLLTEKIVNLTAQIASGRPGSGVTLQPALASLQAFRAGPLPDMSLSQPATAPTGRTSPRVALSVGAAILAGLVLGILGAFALEAFDSTLRREEQLRRLFRLPILTKVPRERGSRRRFPAPRTPDQMSPGALEAYRTLRAMLLASRGPEGPPRSIFVTSASPNEGKTTTAINLATSLAASGASTILIEADVRLPSLAEATGIKSRYGLGDVLMGRVGLGQALVNSPKYPEKLRFLLGQSYMHGGASSADALFLPSVVALLNNAEQLAEYVVIDSPPLVTVIDALELAREADAVLVVARFGHTHLGRLEELGELLGRAGVVPAGIALVGAEPPGGAGAHDYYQNAGVERQSALDAPDLDGSSSAPVAEVGPRSRLSRRK